MNFYKHHLGDYSKKTPHLSILEHGAYRLLIDACYISERPLPANKARIYQIVRATSIAEKKAVDTVLGEFFTLSEYGYEQNRITEELEIYQEAATKSRENGNRGGRPKKTERDIKETREVIKTEPEDNLNQTPEAINQNPELKPKDTPVVNPSTATAVCVVLRSEGMPSVNAQHPELLELIADGAQISEFVYAARIAKDKNKDFAYALGVVKNRRAEALTRGNTPSPLSKKAQGVQRLQEIISD